MFFAYFAQIKTDGIVRPRIFFIVDQMFAPAVVDLDFVCNRFVFDNVGIFFRRFFFYELDIMLFQQY